METTTSSSSSSSSSSLFPRPESVLFGLAILLSLLWLALMMHSCHTHSIRRTVDRAVEAKVAEIDERNAQREAELTATEASLAIQHDAEPENH